MSAHHAPPARSKRRPPRLVRALSVAAFAMLIIAWALERYVAERNGLTAALTYVPQQPLIIPTLLFLLLSAVRRDARSVGVNLIALAFATVMLLDFRIPRTASRPDGPILRVLTWNIRGGQGGLSRIVDEIRAADADVICLQEAVVRMRREDGQTLDTLLAGYSVRRTGDVLIASRLPIIATRILRFEEEGLWRTGLRADVRAGSRAVSILNVHYLTLRRGDPANARSIASAARWQATADVRMEQARETAAWLGNISGPVVLAGDFNTPPRGHAYRTLTERLTGGFDHAGLGFGYTFPARCPVIRIDHIFAGHGSVPVSARVLPFTASDHLPVLAEVLLPAGP